MDSKAVSTKANILIADIEKELKSNNWKDIKTLATEYAGDLDKIIPESKPFGINEQHMKLLVKILKKLREKYAGGDKFFAKKLDSLRFNAHLAEVTAAIVEGNKILNEIHRFFVLQMELKKHLKKFLKNEQKVLETVQETEYSTMFGKRFWGTKHIVKRKGWKGIPTPALADEVVRDIEKENNSSKHTLVEITEAVAKLCEILIAKIDEIVAEEDNVTHHVKDGLEKVTVRYEKEEKAIIADLIKAIEAQKKDMSEEWYPVIDHIDLEKGTVEGHIHYRRYK